MISLLLCLLIACCFAVPRASSTACFIQTGTGRCDEFGKELVCLISLTLGLLAPGHVDPGRRIHPEYLQTLLDAPLDAAQEARVARQLLALDLRLRVRALPLRAHGNGLLVRPPALIPGAPVFALQAVDACKFTRLEPVEV